jgi:hypothetical protein
MRTEMSDNALRQYLGLDWNEFGHLADATRRVGYVDTLRCLDGTSSSLDQLASKYNRPPKADEESDARLEALSRAAFARLDAYAAENEAFRRARSNSSPRGRNRRREDQEEDGRKAAHERGYREPYRDA